MLVPATSRSSPRTQHQGGAGEGNTLSRLEGRESEIRLAKKDSRVTADRKHVWRPVGARLTVKGAAGDISPEKETKDTRSGEWTQIAGELGSRAADRLRGKQGARVLPRTLDGLFQQISAVRLA